MIEDQAINEQDDNKILHNFSDMFSLDQSELTEKLDQVNIFVRNGRRCSKNGLMSPRSNAIG